MKKILIMFFFLMLGCTYKNEAPEWHKNNLNNNEFYKIISEMKNDKNVFEKFIRDIQEINSDNVMLDKMSCSAVSVLINENYFNFLPDDIKFKYYSRCLKGCDWQRYNMVHSVGHLDCDYNDNGKIKHYSINFDDNALDFFVNQQDISLDYLLNLLSNDDQNVRMCALICLKKITKLFYEIKFPAWKLLDDNYKDEYAKEIRGEVERYKKTKVE